MCITFCCRQLLSWMHIEMTESMVGLWPQVFRWNVRFIFFLLCFRIHLWPFFYPASLDPSGSIPSRRPSMTSHTIVSLYLGFAWPLYVLLLCDNAWQCLSLVEDPQWQGLVCITHSQRFQHTCLVLSGRRNGLIMVKSQDLPDFSAGNRQAIKYI